MKKKQSIFTEILLRWFGENGRDLPWRNTSDPYAIWLSEIILQQTRIAQGTDYWLRFMAKWPTVEDLAKASEDEVLRMWQGLGYYSRARNLYAAARQIVALGRFPDTIEEIGKLKGVGDYTAAAIGSIAFGLPAASVDGNFHRVLARHFGIDTPINSTEGKKLFAALAQEHLPHEAPAMYNQAIMDFGAIQCTPVNPKCVICPLAETCVAVRMGKTAEWPVKLKTVKVKERRLAFYYVRSQGRIAIHKRGGGDIWQGLWCVPEAEQLAAEWKGAARLLRRDVRHILTHRILLADFFLLDTSKKPCLPPDFIWIEEAKIDDYGIPRLIEMLVEAVQAAR